MPSTIPTHGPPGPAGPAGATGPQGPQGVPGAGFNYTHTQGSPASTWTVTHNLGGYPSVTATTLSGDVVEGGVHYVDVNSLTLSFLAPFSGYAYLS